MSYNRQTYLGAVKGVSLVQSAGSVLYTRILGPGEAFVLEAVVAKLTVATGGTTAAALTVYKNTVQVATSGGAFPVSTAINTTSKTKVLNTGAANNTFVAGDKLEIKVGVTATTTGSADIDLLIGNIPQ